MFLHGSVWKLVLLQVTDKHNLQANSNEDLEESGFFHSIWL